MADKIKFVANNCLAKNITKNNIYVAKHVLEEIEGQIYWRETSSSS